MTAPLVEINNADVYVAGNLVLSGVTWTMKKNEHWAVVGNNGAGKTTFMKLIFGEIIPVYGGEVRWFGKPDHTPLAEIREHIGFVSAEYQKAYLPHVPGWKVVASGWFSTIGLYDRVTLDQKQTALEWMAFLDITSLAEKAFGALSYGEARRLLLARALVNNPTLLILDEPCSGLDIPTRERFLNTLQKLSRTRTHIIYVTHHIDEILPLTNHVLFLKDGKIAMQGRKEDLLRSKVLSRVLGCELKVKRSDGRYWVTGSRLADQFRPPRG